MLRAHSLSTTIALIAVLPLLIYLPAGGPEQVPIPSCTGVNPIMTARTSSTLAPEEAIPVRILTEFPNPTISYQQEVQFNSSEFRAYLNDNLSNMMFVYENGTPINAWIQSNATNMSTQTTLWLRLSEVINRTVYLVVYPKNTSFLGPTGYLGEAPQLSPIYGEFDNGPRVFSLYSNFRGNSLNRSIWAWQGATANYTINNSLYLGDNQWGGLLSESVFNASNYAPGFYLNFSADVDTNIAVGTNLHVRLLGGSSHYFIGNAYGFTNGSFVGTGGFGFFSLWTNSTVGHVAFRNQTLNISYDYNPGSLSAEQLSLRSDSPGVIVVIYGLLRHLTMPDSGYMPLSTLASRAVSLSSVGLYDVTFVESGLPAGQQWTLGIPHLGAFNTTSTEVSIALVNGSYLFSEVTSDKNFSPTLTSAEVSVNGAGTTVLVQFEYAYPVTFHVLNLQAGWLWSIRIDGSTSGNSYSQSLTLRVINGTHVYHANTSNPGAIAQDGQFVVAGDAIAVSVNFVGGASWQSTADQLYSLSSLIALFGAAAVFAYLKLKRPGV
jgi:hypothetical protein